MNSLVLIIEYDADPLLAQLFATLNYEGFCGKGGCFVNLNELVANAKLNSQFPLGDDHSIVIEGGYFNEDMLTLNQTHLHISVSTRNSKGALSLNIILQTPIDLNIDSFEAKLSCSIPITYENLVELSGGLLGLATRQQSQFRLNL